MIFHSTRVSTQGQQNHFTENVVPFFARFLYNTSCHIHIDPIYFPRHIRNDKKNNIIVKWLYCVPQHRKYILRTFKILNKKRHRNTDIKCWRESCKKKKTSSHPRRREKKFASFPFSHSFLVIPNPSILFKYLSS